MSTETRAHSRERHPDMSRADVRDTLWIELRQAHQAVDRLARRHRTPAGDRDLLRDRGYRDGLLTAYAILTGQSEEDVYESLQDSIAE